MTPDDLLLELRDIHLPNGAAGQIGAGFSWLPMAALAVCLLALLWSRYRRSRIWLHQARARLDQIGGEIDATPSANPDANKKSNDALLELARQIAPHRTVTPFPAAVFLPPEKLDSDHLKQIRDHLRAVLDA